MPLALTLGLFSGLRKMEPCTIRSIGVVSIRGRKFLHWRFSNDYSALANYRRCVISNISANGGRRGRKGEGGMEGLREKGEQVWAREEVKVTSRRGGSYCEGRQQDRRTTDL